jgi:hypothetical protein
VYQHETPAPVNASDNLAQYIVFYVGPAAPMYICEVQVYVECMAGKYWVAASRLCEVCPAGSVCLDSMRAGGSAVCVLRAGREWEWAREG